jgi:hypothetical protein
LDGHGSVDPEEATFTRQICIRVSGSIGSTDRGGVSRLAWRSHDTLGSASVALQTMSCPRGSDQAMQINPNLHEERATEPEWGVLANTAQIMPTFVEI